MSDDTTPAAPTPCPNGESCDFAHHSPPAWLEADPLYRELRAAICRRGYDNEGAAEALERLCIALLTSAAEANGHD